jgi:nascent polypeptide-associated complex subunit alpha
MFPGGMDPRSMKKQLQRMGISSEELDAVEVIIKGPKKSYRIKDPGVMRMVVQGQEMFQISGKSEEISLEVAELSSTSGETGVPSFSEEDIELVVSQAKVTREVAVRALMEHEGAPAEAIVALMSRKR